MQAQGNYTSEATTTVRRAGKDRVGKGNGKGERGGGGREVEEEGREGKSGGTRRKGSRRGEEGKRRRKGSGRKEVGVEKGKG